MNLGKIYLSWNDWDESLRYFELVKDIILKSPWLYRKNLWRADCSIGIIHYHKGEIKKSLEIFERIYLEISNLKLKHLLFNNFIGVIIMPAYLNGQIGNYEKQNYYIELLTEYFNKNQIPSLDIFWHMAKLYSCQRKFGLSELICLKALKLYSSDNEIFDKMLIYLALLDAYIMQGKFADSDQAIEYLQLNINQFDRSLEFRIKAYNLIGKAFCMRKDSKKAEIFLKKSEELYEKNLKILIQGRADLYGLLGVTYKDMERLEESEVYFKKALNMNLNISYNVNGALDTYAKLVGLYRIKNDWQTCKHYLLEYLKFSKANNPNHNAYLSCLGTLVHACKITNDHATGEKYFGQLMLYMVYKHGNANTLEVTDDNNNIIAKINLNNYYQ